MDPVVDIAAKRRLLIEGLVICLSHSAVADLVPPDVARAVFGSASSDLWRGGEFRLETVWKVLCQQPGVDPNACSPPLLALKRFESILGVTVVLPSALAALSPAEQERLASIIPLDADRFTVLVSMSAPPMESDPLIDAAGAVAAASAGIGAGGSLRAAEPAPPKRLALVGALAGVGILIAVAVTVLDRPSQQDPSVTKSVLALEHAIAQDKSFAATISDPRWPGMSKEEQTRVATEAFDLLIPQGIEVMSLKDASGRVAVIASHIDGTTQVTVP